MTKKDYELLVSSARKFLDAQWSSRRRALNNNDQEDAERCGYLRDGVIQFFGHLSVDLGHDNPNFDHLKFQNALLEDLDRDE